MEQKDSDLQKIKELIEIMKDNDLIEVELKHGDEKIVLKRSEPQSVCNGGMTAIPVAISGIPAAVPASQQETADMVAETSEQENISEIKSPIVGTFYLTPNPDAEAFVEPGSHVDGQTVVCIIEAMKVMNEIKAEIGGTITEVCVDNGQAVEYGQVLFKVKPD